MKTLWLLVRVNAFTGLSLIKASPNTVRLVVNDLRMQGDPGLWQIDVYERAPNNQEGRQISWPEPPKRSITAKSLWLIN